MELLERDEILETLGSLLAEAGQGRGRIALIRGEAGIGKTSVIRSFIESIADESHVLYGSCENLLTPRPLGPIRDMAAEAPALDEALASGDRELVFQEMMELLSRTLRPTLAVVEDIHWAAGATLDLLTSLGRRIDRTRALLVMSFREELAEHHPVAMMVGNLPQDRLTSFELKPLSREAVVTLAQHREASATPIWKTTGGNPFFVTELLKTDVEDIPASVRDAIRARLYKLTAKGEQLVQLASVVPGSVELRLIEEIDTGLLDAVGETESAGFLEVTGDSLAFRHELARMAVETSLSETSKRDLNQRVLRACESLDLDVARGAHHARQAHDADAMVRLLPAAARQAAATGSHREATSQLRALQPYLDALPPRERADIYDLWSFEEELVTGNGLDKALQAVELRRGLGEPLRLGNSLLRGARSAYYAGKPAMAWDLAEEAAAVLEKTDGESHAQALAELSRLAMLAYDFDRATALARSALELAPKPGRVRVNALITLGVCRAITDYPEGTELLRESAQISKSLGFHRELDRARSNHASVATRWKDLDVAKNLNETAILELGDEGLAASAWHLGLRGLLHLLSGDFGSAEGILRDLIERADIEEPDRVGITVNLAKTLIRKGDAGAEDVLRVATLDAEEIDEPQHRISIAARWAEYLWAFGRQDDEITQRNLVALGSAESYGPWDIADLALWLWLDGHITDIPKGAAEPIRQLAAGEWKKAADWFAARGLPYEQAIALNMGDPNARIQAVRIADHLGAAALASRIRSHLRSDGIRGVPRSPARDFNQPVLGLTPRQTEVLGLLDLELTNKQIADRLFISARTAEKHVSAILQKLNLKTRIEAGAYARDQGLAKTT